MERRSKGFALMLFSLILLLGFQSLGWDHILDLSLTWQHLFLLMGTVGFGMAFFGSIGPVNDCVSAKRNSYHVNVILIMSTRAGRVGIMVRTSGWITKLMARCSALGPGVPTARSIAAQSGMLPHDEHNIRPVSMSSVLVSVVISLNASLGIGTIITQPDMPVVSAAQ